MKYLTEEDLIPAHYDFRVKNYVIAIWEDGVIYFVDDGQTLEEMTLGDLMYIRDVGQEFVEAKKLQKEKK